MPRKPIAPQVFLAGVPLFRELDAASLDRLAAGATRRPLKRGERLFHKGDDAICKKIGEEATEVVLAAKDIRIGGADNLRQKLVNETADLWFHCMVLLAHHDLSPQEVLAELARREGLSGLVEKAQRGTRGEHAD